MSDRVHNTLPQVQPSKRDFRVLKTLGGCGGTIIARALAATGTLVLSEVNPRSAQLFGGALNPLVQMRKYHPDLLAQRLQDIDPHSLGSPDLFGKFISDIYDSITIPLVLRDYSYIDNIGVPFIWPQPAEPCLEMALEPFGKIRSVLIVRHPDACYKSLLTHASLKRTLTPQLFVRGHLRFYQNNVGAEVIRYEDFLADTDQVLGRICSLLKINFKKDWRNKLKDVGMLTGNERAISADKIEAPLLSVPTSEGKSGLSGVAGYQNLLAWGKYA